MLQHPGVSDRRALPATFCVVLTAILGSAFYAAWNARGLYLDGTWVLYRIAESNWFYLPAPARATVDLIRQAPIVLLTNYTDLSLVHRAQIFSLVMSALPALLIVACWFIAPPKRKSWILFPLAYLLIGIAPAAFLSQAESPIGTAYFWVLLFILLFRTRTSISQAVFLALCIPTFQLIEAACLLMPILLLVCIFRWRLAKDLQERIFLAVSVALIVSITIYQAGWVISPRVPTDRELFLSGLQHFGFLLHDGHVNLPFITGVFAFAALTAVFIMASAHSRRLAIASRAIVFGFAVYVLLAVAAAFLAEQSFSPYSHYHARYFPVLISLILGTVAVWLHAWGPPERIWMQPETLSILILLCVAQTAADTAATVRWREYISDLQSRLTTSSGLISYESTLDTGDARRDFDWRMQHDWLLPIMSIIFAKDGIVRSMLDCSAHQAFRPSDPEKPGELPKLRGIDYRPYRGAMAAQRASAER
jgi:hypothetical protein